MQPPDLIAYAHLAGTTITDQDQLEGGSLLLSHLEDVCGRESRDMGS